jgi:hypothetical protein
MLKKISRPVSILLSLIFLLSCSRFDETTSLGKDIIQDIDPLLTDVNQNFKTLDSMIVLNSFSIPDQNDSYFGIHRASISVGSKDNVSASGFVEFEANTDFLNKFGMEATDISTFKVDSISLQVYTYKDSSENARIPKKLDLYLCINSDSISRTALARQFPITSLYLSEDSTHYSGSSNNTTIRDSVEKFISNIKEQLKICATDSCKNLLKTYLRFYIFSDDSNSVAHLSTEPTMKFFARKGPDSIRVSITPRYTNYVAIDHNIDSISKIPISKFATQRTAVFKLDISNLWETMKSFKSFRILSAGFSITPKTYKDVYRDNEESQKLNVLYHLSDKLYDNNSAFHDQILRRVEKSVSADSTGAPADTFVLRNLEDIFHKLSSSRPPIVYLYLQLSGNEYRWKEVLWNNPEFKAILTTLE